MSAVRGKRSLTGRTAARAAGTFASPLAGLVLARGELGSPNRTPARRHARVPSGPGCGADRNANHKLMRAKIDATWRSEIDAAYAEDASKLDTAWVHFKG